MKSYFYIAKTVLEGMAFAEANTDWKRVTRVSFRSGDKNIIVISQFNNIRGRKVDGIYLDPSYYENREWGLFEERIGYLEITPEHITQK